VSDDATGRARASTSDVSTAGLDALADEVVPALIARLRASRLGELEVRSGSWRVRLRRDPGVMLAPAGLPSILTPEATGVLDGSVARSPAVGYFTPVPDLALGQPVQAGDVIGSIDVLGIAQEVTAPADGIISALLAEDGQAVEYGQALAEIDPLEPLPASEPAEESAAAQPSADAG
jgi:acetyl-CoA carboxylase biotin carboxyl carrier protein